MVLARRGKVSRAFHCRSPTPTRWFMRRREFIALVLSGAAACPAPSRAQQPLPTLGFMSSRSPEDSAYLLTPFRQGLEQAGLVESRDVNIEYRWAGGEYERLRQIANEFVARDV